MKKVLSLSLLLVLLLTACAPTADPVPLSVGETNTVAGKLEFTLADFYRADSVAPPIPTGDYPVYDAPEGDAFLVAVMDVENLASFGYSADSLLELTLTAAEVTYAPTCLMLTEGGTALENGHTMVNGRSVARLYYLFAVPPETADATLTATVGSQPYTALLTPGDGPKLERTALGQTLTADGLSLKLDTFTAAQKLRPSTPAPLHTFFDAGEGKTHLILKATVTNFGSAPVPRDQIAGVTVGTAVCTPILEAADGSDLSDDGAIDPGQSRVVYFAVAADASQADNTATLTVAFGGQTYRFSASPKA